MTGCWPKSSRIFRKGSGIIRSMTLIRQNKSATDRRNIAVALERQIIGMRGQ